MFPTKKERRNNTKKAQLNETFFCKKVTIFFLAILSHLGTRIVIHDKVFPNFGSKNVKSPKIALMQCQFLSCSNYRVDLLFRE